MSSRPYRVLGAWLTEEALRDPNREFIQCDSPWLTLGELDALSDQAAAGLQALGVGKGDRVAVNLANRIEYVVLIYAIAKTGAIQVPLNTYLRGEFLRHQLAQTTPMVYIGDEPAVRVLEPLLDKLDSIETVVLLDGAERPDLAVAQVPYAELFAHTSNPKPVELRPDDVCCVIYTSGTTGPSKGCTITHGYYCNLINTFIDYGWYAAGDVVFGANPLFHFSGQTWLVAAALAVRGSVIVEPRFSASTYMARIRATGATCAMGMGAMGVAVLAQPVEPGEREHVLRHITFMPSSPELTAAFEERFGIAPYSEVYGQSECWPATLGDRNDPPRPGSMGKITPGMQVKIVDDDDVEVPTGEAGELVVRTDELHRLFIGYFNDAEATVRVSRNLWHHTGDNGRVDEDGYFWFVDRKKDSLRRRGENVSSLELEAAIAVHPAIAEVAIHAVPSALSEDDIKACIVLKPGATLGLEELFVFLRSNVPYYAVPRYVEFIDELPVNVNGRVQKFRLRERGVTADTYDFDGLGLVIARSERRSV